MKHSKFKVDLPKLKLEYKALDDMERTEQAILIFRSMCPNFAGLKMMYPDVLNGGHITIRGADIYNLIYKAIDEKTS